MGKAIIKQLYGEKDNNFREACEGNVGKAIIKQLYGEKDNNFREACEDFERHPDVWITIDPNIGIEQ